MSVINQQVFIDVVTNPASPNFFLLRGDIGGATNRTLSVPENGLDRDAAILLLDQIKDYVKKIGWYGWKALRPYHYDTFDYLDRSEPWWGFEFETGYASEAHRAEAIEAAVAAADNGVTFDCEGDGMIVSEITFSPAEQSKYLDGTAPAYKFIEWLDTHPEHVFLSGDEFVGTHLNLSCPDTSNDEYYRIALSLNNSLHLLPVNTPEGKNTRALMFGRKELYGGCHVPDGKWIEMKLFRTTYSLEIFKNYVRTAQALTKIVQHLKATGQHGCDFGVSNLYEMWLDPSVEPEVIEDLDLQGEYEGWYISDPNATEDTYRDDDDYYDEDDYDEGDSW